MVRTVLMLDSTVVRFPNDLTNGSHPTDIETNITKEWLLIATDLQQCSFKTKVVSMGIIIKSL